IRGPQKDSRYTLVAAARVRDGEQLEKSLRAALKELPAREQAQFKLDVEKVGGLATHRADPPEHDSGYRALFGQEPTYFAVRADAIFVAAGPDALAAIKEALKVEPQAARPVQLELSMARIAQVMSREKPQAPKAAAEAFARERDADRIRFAI